MSTAHITKRIPESSPHVHTRFVAAYYLLTIMTGAFLLFFDGKLAFAADLAVAVFYLMVTAFLYGWSESANKRKNALKPRS